MQFGVRGERPSATTASCRSWSWSSASTPALGWASSTSCASAVLPPRLELVERLDSQGTCPGSWRRSFMNLPNETDPHRSASIQSDTTRSSSATSLLLM